MKRAPLLLASFALLTAITCPFLRAQTKIVWTPQEDAIRQQIRTLRAVPDDDRGRVTKKIALEIRELPAAQNKVLLADGLAGLSTEGFFGQDALQAVADTLTGALKETPQPDDKGQPAEPYVELATLV